MRRSLLVLLPLLGGCGGAEPCTVVQIDRGADVRCPDGTHHRLEPALTCEVDEGWLRCRDGSAVPLGPGALAGCELSAAGDVVNVTCEDGSLRTIPATETGGISGEVYVAGEEDFAGVRVSVRGREAVTSADGRYRVQLVPVGRYTVRFSRAGYDDVFVEDVPVLPGTYELPAVLMR